MVCEFRLSVNIILVTISCIRFFFYVIILKIKIDGVVKEVSEVLWSLQFDFSFG